MEGPSLFLAAEQLAPFINQKILKVEGNSKIGIERLQGKKVLDIFSWGKHLVFQFDHFALRVHFMLFGTFEATLKNLSLTGDYKRSYLPRLAIFCKMGEILLFNCSLVFLEEEEAKSTYDFKTDIMSSQWDRKLALQKIKSQPTKQIADLLLDQTIFSGVGNIIKNEVLFLEKVSPEKKILDLSTQKLSKIIKATKEYSLQFLAWRREFVLKKHFRIYRKKLCPSCKGPVERKKTGLTQRWSYICPYCQRSPLCVKSD